MNDVVTATTTKPTKNFWDRPEGLWGMVLGTVALGGIIWFLTWFVPMMLSLGLGILGLAIVWGTIVSLGYTAFTDNILRRTIMLKFQIGVTKLRRSIVNEDPIAILRMLQTKARKRMEEFDNLVAPVKAAKIGVTRATNQYSEQLENLKAACNLAKKQGDEEQVSRTLTRIGKIDKYFQDMTSLGQDVQKMDQMLMKAKKVVTQIIDDADFEINNEEIHLKAAQSVSSAWGKLRSVFKASTDEADLRSEALRAAADQCDARLGEIDNWMEEFKGVLETVGTQDAINAEKARMKMENLNNIGTTALIENKPAQAISSFSIPIKVPNIVPVRRS